MRSLFACLDEKCQLVENSEKILKIFDEISIEIFNFYFILFLKICY